MLESRPELLSTEPGTLNLELRGHYSNRMQIAQTLRSVYDVLDQLCNTGNTRFTLVYHEDFQVDSTLLDEFSRAASKALAYKEALSFGRAIDTQIVGLERISCPKTRQMVQRLHKPGFRA